MFQSQMRVNGDQLRELWAIRGGDTCLQHYTVEWPDTLEPWRLPSSCSWDLYWLAMESEIWSNIDSCVLCYQIKALNHSHYGLNMSQSLPSCPWEGLVMDFDPDFHKSRALGCSGILVNVSCAHSDHPPLQKGHWLLWARMNVDPTSDL